MFWNGPNASGSFAPKFSAIADFTVLNHRITLRPSSNRCGIDSRKRENEDSATYGNPLLEVPDGPRII
jgi:hypothetical protein